MRYHFKNMCHLHVRTFLCVLLVCPNVSACCLHFHWTYVVL